MPKNDISASTNTQWFKGLNVIAYTEAKFKGQNQERKRERGVYRVVKEI